MKFTDEEIRMLVKANQMMDSGEISYVVYKGDRWAMSKECMDHFGLKNGQTVDIAIIQATLKFKKDLLEKIILEKELSEVKPEDFMD